MIATNRIDEKMPSISEKLLYSRYWFHVPINVCLFISICFFFSHLINDVIVADCIFNGNTTDYRTTLIVYILSLYQVYNQGQLIKFS